MSNARLSLAEREGVMKNAVPVVICVLLMIGGSMMMTDGAATTSVSATYAVAAPAPPVPQGDPAPGVEMKTPYPDGLLMPKTPMVPLEEQLALLDRAGCVGRTCPLNSSKSTTSVLNVNACDAVATADREIVLGRPLRAVAQVGGAVVGVVRAVVGRERRLERREARRGG